MTTLAPPERLRGVLALGTSRLLAGVGTGHRVDLVGHRRLHRLPAAVDRKTLIAMTAEVALLGRGGAAFPVAAKLAGTPSGTRTHVLVNGSEGEPASHKDRVLMRLTPHLVLDGALAVARALGTRRLTIVVHDDPSAASLTAAIRERTDATIVRIVHEPGRFVSGEVRAAVRAADGNPALPGGRRVLPTVSGIGGAPTFASNVETFAQIGVLLGLGPAEYAAVGSPDEPGTTLLTLWGDVVAPAVVEVPTGMPLAALLPGPDDRPVLLGGYHGTWLPAAGNLTISRPGLCAAGLRLNAAVVARLPHDTCALGEVAAVTRWLAGESAGQCGPCLFGLPSLADTVDRLLRGEPVGALARRRADLVEGRGACAHPDGAAQLVRSALTALAPEISTHASHGTCGRAVLGVLPVPEPARPPIAGGRR